MLLHHSYVIYTLSDSTELISKFVYEQNFLDVTTLNCESFGIDDSRNLIKLAYQQPLENNNKKLIVVKPNVFTLEAQQSLLKILEEPPNSTIFLFVLQNSNSIISTLKSRFFEYKLDEIKEESTNSSFEEFVNLNHKDRLLLINKRLDKNDVEWVREIKFGLAVMLKNSLLQLNLSQRKALIKVMLNLGSRGASNKMLLEEMSFSIPYTA